jgi:very-short-patch-repair endonuclease
LIPPFEKEGIGGDFSFFLMLRYKANLKQSSRLLRKNLTDSERVLWSRLRGKQLSGVQFYRQKPLGDYIVDFYAPQAKLVVEVDGSQHLEGQQADEDRRRDKDLESVGLRVLRFNSREVLAEIEAVVEAINKAIGDFTE